MGSFGVEEIAPVVEAVAEVRVVALMSTSSSPCTNSGLSSSLQVEVMAQCWRRESNWVSVRVRSAVCCSRRWLTCCAFSM